MGAFAVFVLSPPASRAAGRGLGSGAEQDARTLGFWGTERDRWVWECPVLHEGPDSPGPLARCAGGQGVAAEAAGQTAQ